MTKRGYMCLVHLKKEAYIVDHEAFYLLCRLQEVNFGFEDEVPRADIEKMKMYKLTLEWLIDMGRCIKLERNPTHLIIKFEEEER